jgi:hypothetical protein
MAVSRMKIWTALIIVIFGGLVGSAFGELMGRVLPAGPVKSFFLNAVSVGFQPFHLDLSIFTINLGVMLHLNVISIIGMIVFAYLLRWFY